MTFNNFPKTIIISRTDNIGDVIVTLPLAAFLKQQAEDIFIYFIGKSYTKDIIEKCPFVDQFLDRDEIIASGGLPASIQADAVLFVYPDKELEKKIYKQVPIRVGTSNRWYHWLYLNKRISFSRKNSPLHEAQLNFFLLLPWIKNPIPDLALLKSYTLLQTSKSNRFTNILNPSAKKHIIFHTKSKGSAREWPMASYLKLAQLLAPLQYQVYISGTENEGKQIKEQCPELFNQQNITDVTGKFPLATFVEFIDACDTMVACSTGPLHIAAGLNKKTVGIYPPIKPMHAGRWAPLGSNSFVLSSNISCDSCRKSGLCHCIQEILPESVFNILTH
jgi:heptosyltransferase-3